MEWFSISFEQFVGIIVSTTLIYISLMIIVKINGLSSFSKMSAHDFAVTIAIGSILGAITIQKEPSLLQGIIAIAAFLALQTLYSLWRILRPAPYLENVPMMLMRGEVILHENLKRARMTEADLLAKLRESNVLDISQVQAVIFETSGDISVLQGNSTPDKELLKDIR